MNFILRIVSNDNYPEKRNPDPLPIINKMLGEEYRIVLATVHKTAFKTLSEDFHTPEDETLFGVLVRWDGLKYGLWSGYTHYIMTESGSTFEKIYDPRECKAV